MSLPVSQYEALLAEVRGLRRQAQHVQQLADPLLFSDASLPEEHNVTTERLHFTMDTLLTGRNNTTTCYEDVSRRKIETETSEDESAGAQSTNNSVSSEPICQNTREVNALYHGTWPVERTMWNSEPATLEINQLAPHRQMEMPSVMSFASSSGAPMERVFLTPDRSRRTSQQLEAKVDMVYSLLAMLGGQEHADMGETLLALSTNPESCLAMRQSGCIPLLVQLVQSDRHSETRIKASKALHNLVHSQPDEKLRKRETRILKLLETVCAYNEALKNDVEFVCENISEDDDRHPVQTIAHLMKLSFDEGHRQAICQLGGIHTIAKLVEAEHSVHGSTIDEHHCILMRRYACMALTNLTFGDSGNKALLCSYKDFIRALVVQLQSPSDELRQVTASVLRNLSWRADSSSKDILKQVCSVKGLMTSAMLDNKENTLKSILSALWNLSAHCTENKSEICSVKGALAFLVQMLQYKSSTKSLAIIENSGGILRNISSQIAVRDDYREILREHNCLQILLDQLKSPSLTIVSNACGTLWNLSAKNTTDQELLWQLGAPAMLRSLNHSKHKMIAMGSSATLKNLLSAKPGQALPPHMDSTALTLELPTLPTLGMRKQKALLKDLDQNLSETFDNIDPSPGHNKKIKNKQNRKEVSPDDSPLPEFASLNINEPSTSFSQDRKSRIPQCNGPSSLPHFNSDLKGPSTSTPMKNKSPAFAFDELELQLEPTCSGRKQTKSKSKSGISRRSDSSKKCTSLKMDYGSGYAEIGCEQSPEDICADGPGNCVKEEITGRGRSKSSADTSKLKLILNNSTVIDNDKHKTKEKFKEIVANMDEKDHCSTEDISDSEVQQVKMVPTNSDFRSVQITDDVKGNLVERVHLRGNNHEETYYSLNISLPLDDKDDKYSSISGSSLPISELPNTLSHDDRPSVKPRISRNEDKPQPSPRSLPKSCLQADKAIKLKERNASVRMVPNVEHTEEPNIPKHQESVEDNTLQKEELNEKQDVGKEKKANSIKEYMVNVGHDENINAVQNEKSGSSILASSSRLQSSKEYSKANTGIPMSRVPSRSSPPKSSSITEDNNVAADNSRIQAFYTPDKESGYSAEKVNKPSPCNRISSSVPDRSSQPTTTTCSPQIGNMRREGKKETTKVSVEDLNRKYDISLSDEMQTCNPGSESNDCRDSDPKKVEMSIDEKPTLDSIKDTSAEFGSSNENNAIQFTINPSSSLGLQDSLGKLDTQDPTSYRELSGVTSMDSGIPQRGSEYRNMVAAPIQENLAKDLKKSELNKSIGQILDMSPEYTYSNTNNCLVFSDKNGERLERSCNDAAVVVDTRMLDPDAMIESLDRFTAELVSQASSHLQHKDSLYKSGTNDNTWDENSSPNELTFPSISVSAPNVISFKSESENDSFPFDKNDEINQQQEQYSNDFSSYNTSTMTESTLIAMEATKIAAAFKEGADMSMSAHSLVSLELDNIQPPSHLNSLSNSVMGLDSKSNSPKMARKKSLPSNIMVRRALNHSISHTSSVDSLEYQSTSAIGEISSSEGSDSIKNFIINGPVSKDFPHMPSGIKAPSSLLHFITSSNLHSVTDIENINPPSMLNEINDMCNSLADTSAICSETEAFEDCFTHVDNTLRTDDVTEFSDANSVTPIQSDVSSNENTPKRQKTLSKSLTSKQKRALAKERYKTYTIAAEMVMKESLVSQNEETSDYFKTAHDATESVSDDATYASPTYTVDSNVSKLSPKERRLSDRGRFQTQVLEVSQLLQNMQEQNSVQQQNGLEVDSPEPSPSQSPSRSKISVRKNVMQRRLINKDRFKTQTLDSSKFSPDLPVSNGTLDDSELYQMVEKEANKVLKTLRDTKTCHDELLDCETLSLVSNEDESEHNSGSSVNYRTYHKSWGLRHDIPTITSVESTTANDSTESDEDEINRVPRKPKIVKPDEKVIEKNVETEEPKGIRGKRKSLYSKSNVAPKSIKPSRNVTSNLVKNVTSTLKSTTKVTQTVAKPPTYQGRTSNPSNRPVSGNGSPQRFPASSNASPRSSPKRSISRPISDGKPTVSNISRPKSDGKSSISRPTSDAKPTAPKQLERQGTFTKDESPVTTPQPQVKSKIPGFASKIPSTSAVSKIPTKPSNIPRSGLFKSASSDRNSKVVNAKIYNRSTSADSRESGLSRRIQSSLSSHSLKSETAKVQQNGAIKKTIQNQRSNSNTSLNGSSNTKKQVTSKIASIWKKIEESKKKTPSKSDSKKWIEAQIEPSEDSVESVPVVVRQTDSDNNAPKRISRLGSFIVMDENEDSFRLQQVVCGATNDD